MILLKYVEDKLSRKILEQARKQQNELEAEFGAGSSSRKSLKEPQTKLDVGELIGSTLESDDDNDDEGDVASTANEQFYENFVSDYLNSFCQEQSYWGVVTTCLCYLVLQTLVVSLTKVEVAENYVLPAW